MALQAPFDGYKGPLKDPQFARTLAMKAPEKSQAADAAVRFQFGRIGRATALGLAAGQAAPAD